MVKSNTNTNVSDRTRLVDTSISRSRLNYVSDNNYGQEIKEQEHTVLESIVEGSCVTEHRNAILCGKEIAHVTNGTSTSDSNADVGEECVGGWADDVEPVSLLKVSRRKKVVLLLCGTARFFNGCACSAIAPIFPVEAQRKGMSLHMAGFVFSTYGLLIFLTSPILGKYITRIGVKFLFLSGIFIGGSSTILFGFLDRCPYGTSFAVMSILCRAVEAFGFACFLNAVLTTVTNTFRENIGSALSIVQTSGSVGFMVGPAIGGLLYDVGGFGLPFYVMGSLVLLNGIFFYYAAPDLEDTVKVNDKRNNNSNSMLGLFRSPLVVVPMISVFVMASGILMYDSLFAIHMLSFHLSASTIGLLFLIAPLTNASLAPLWGFISDGKDIKGPLMVLGQLSYALSFWINGPSYLLPFVPFKLWTVCLGNVCLGMGFGILNVISIKCMLDGAYELKYDKSIETYGLVSGLYSTAFSCGQFCGPMLGSAMVQNIGFSHWFTAFGIINFCLMFFMIGYFLYRYLRRRGSRKIIDVNVKNASHTSQPFS